MPSPRWLRSLRVRRAETVRARASRPGQPAGCRRYARYATWLRRFRLRIQLVDLAAVALFDDARLSFMVGVSAPSAA